MLNNPLEVPGVAHSTWCWMNVAVILLCAYLCWTGGVSRQVRLGFCVRALTVWRSRRRMRRLLWEAKCQTSIRGCVFQSRDRPPGWTGGGSFPRGAQDGWTNYSGWNFFVIARLLFSKHNSHVMLELVISPTKFPLS